ncbi:hypothetical protein B0O80DRAFT_421832 [Mortierella sp. GBAus27b]|nr:hypothetical protein B0O80DRAFT_421832 [Mortierella sp. GBAus27b]
MHDWVEGYPVESTIVITECQGSMGATAHWSPPDGAARIGVTISMLHDDSGVGDPRHLQPVQSRRLHTGRQHVAQARVDSGCYVAIVVVYCTSNSNMFTLQI